jgi:hypothetical protein
LNNAVNPLGGFPARADWLAAKPTTETTANATARFNQVSFFILNIRIWDGQT